MRVLSLKEARTVQKEREKKAIQRFCFCFAAILSLNVAADILFVRFQADSRLIPLLAFLSLLILGFLFVRCRMHLFFQKKELTGIVVSTRADALPTHPYAAHIAGVRCRTVDQLCLELVVRAETGPEAKKKRTYVRQCVLTEELKSLRDGERVALLRFIDQPIRLDRDPDMEGK